MLHPSVQAKKYKFWIVVDPGNKFLVPLATNKTVDNLIEVVKTRLHKKLKSVSQTPISSVNTKVSDDNIQSVHHVHHSQEASISQTPPQIQPDIDSLNTMYWVDAQTMKPRHIYVLLRGSDKLQRVLNTYKSMLSNESFKLKQFYWFIARSPTQVLNIPELKPSAICRAPEEIRQKYHRVWNILFSVIIEYSIYFRNILFI